MEHHSLGGMLSKSCQIFFQASFRQKTEILQFFSKQIRHSPLHCPLFFLNFDAHFYKLLCRIHLLIAELHWQRRDSPGLKFSAAENFLTASFRRKQLEIQIFQRGSVTSLHLFGLISNVWHPIAR